MTCRAALSCGRASPTTASSGRCGQGAHAGTSSPARRPELAQRLAEHRRAVRRAGPVVVHRRALAAQHLGRRLDRLARSTAGPRARPRWRAPGSASRRRRRARSGPGRTTPSITSSAKPTATLEMSSNRRLAILWNAASPASGSGIRTARISSPGRRTVCAVAGEVVGQRHLALAVAARPARRRPRARAARAAGRRSASRCRGCRRWWRRCGSAATRTAGTPRRAAAPRRRARRSTSRQGERGADQDRRRRRRASSRSSGSRSIATAYAARAPRRLTSTPQSVRAGDDGRVGVLGEQRERLGQVGRAGEAAVGPVEPGGDAAPAAGLDRRRGERVVVERAGRARRRRRGSGGSRCSGRGCRSARAGRSRWGRARGRSARRPVPFVRPARGRRGRTRRPCCRRSRACSSRTASRRARPSRAAPGAGRRGRRGPRR